MGVTFGAFTPDTYAAILAETAAPVQATQAALYVNSYTGNDANPGTSPSAAKGTLAAAIALAEPGMTIGLFGVFKEHVTGPLVNDVTLVGMGNLPRQATTSGAANGGGATWLSASGGTTALLTVRGQGWTVQNVFFNNSATAAPCIDLVTVGDPPTEADAAHFQLINCILTGSDNGLDALDGTNFVRIIGCTFFGFSGAGDIAINATGGIGTLLDWRILGCKFYNNAANITAALSHGTIRYCDIENGSASNINLTNGTAPNFVQFNAFNIAAADFDPAGGTTGVTGDVWANYLTDGVEIKLPDD